MGLIFQESNANPFVAMCKFEENIHHMSFDNCNLFRRSFTTQGIGYTFNSEMDETLIKSNYQNIVFSTKNKPSLMKSTSFKHSLTAIIQNNIEEVQRYENRQSNDIRINHRPRKVYVSLHDPKEPADTRYIPLTSVWIPLGHSTTFLISAKAREIADSGRSLTESERGCRLNEDTDVLEIFNVYTRVSCLFECNMKHAVSKCGCTPWNYPVNMKKAVRSSCIYSYNSKIIIFLEFTIL